MLLAKKLIGLNWIPKLITKSLNNVMSSQLNSHYRLSRHIMLIADHVIKQPESKDLDKKLSQN